MGIKIYTASDAIAQMPAIVEPADAQLDLEIGNAWHALRLAEQRETKTGEKVAAAQDIHRKASEEARKRALALGQLLVEKHRNLKIKQGDRSGKWAAFLTGVGIPAETARRYMALAGHVETSPTKDNAGEVPTYAEAGIDLRPRKADEQPNPPDDPWYPEPQPTHTERAGGRGKPQWLMRVLVQHYTVVGDLVCDPLAGWGSTLRAALDEGRRAIGSEVDAAIAAQAGELPIRIGDWRTALAGEHVDAIITDPPYSARTHAASRKFGNEREDGSPLNGLGPEYAAWSPDDVRDFVSSWSPRCRGWIVALTDHHLIPAWQEAYEAAGRYSFAPVSIVIRGMTVRLCGDGPSSETLYAMVARPATSDASRWKTLPGAYVGTKSRSLDELLAGAE